MTGPVMRGSSMDESDDWGFNWDDELELSDIVAAARLAGMIPGTGRFSPAILAAGYRRTEATSPQWELRSAFTDVPADSTRESA